MFPLLFSKPKGHIEILLGTGNGIRYSFSKWIVNDLKGDYGFEHVWSWRPILLLVSDVCVKSR